MPTVVPHTKHVVWWWWLTGRLAAPTPFSQVQQKMLHSRSILCESACHMLLEVRSSRCPLVVANKFTIVHIQGGLLSFHGTCTLKMVWIRNIKTVAMPAFVYQMMNVIRVSGKMTVRSVQRHARHSLGFCLLIPNLYWPVNVPTTNRTAVKGCKNIFQSPHYRMLMTKGEDQKQQDHLVRASPFPIKMVLLRVQEYIIFVTCLHVSCSQGNFFQEYTVFK